MAIPTHATQSFRRWLLPVCISLLAGCTVGPDYQQPANSVPETFKYDEGWAPVPENSWEQSGEWWQAFGDTQLNQLVDDANRNNQTLVQAEARYRAALALRRSSLSNLSPELSASLLGTRAGGSDSAVSESVSAGLNIDWEVDLWGNIRRQIESDTASLEASAADLAAAKLSIQLAVVYSYITLQSLQQQYQILTETQQTAERALSLTINQYDAGIVSRADVIQAQTQLQSLESDRYDLREQEAVEMNLLAALLGMAPVSFNLDSKPTALLVPNLPQQLPSSLIARRPDVVAAERLVAAANANIGVATAAWLPTFSLGAGLSANANTFDNLWDSPIRIWSVGPSLVQTLFDGGSRRAAKDVALADYDEQIAVYRQTVLDSIAEIENALATSTILRQKSVQQEKLVELAEENLRVITNRYKSGLVSFLEVATAQNSALDARQSLVNVTSERLSAAADLAAAIGGSWEIEP